MPFVGCLAVSKNCASGVFFNGNCLVKHLSHYYRYLWQGPELVVVVGDAARLWQGQREYDEKLRIGTSGSGTGESLRRLLAAAGLASVSLPERESWGWTMSLPGSTVGLFCGVEPEGMVCGTVRRSEPDADAVVVQRQKEKSPLTQSHYTLHSADPVQAVAQYFEECVQMLVRAALLDDGRGAFVLPLPGHGFGPLDGLTDRELVERCCALAGNEHAKLLDEVVLFYECRCSDDMILKMITDLPAAQRAELWKESSSITVNCPRCGRVYTLTRK
jgi:hypothetical protein